MGAADWMDINGSGIGTFEIASLRSGVRRPAEEYPRSKLAGVLLEQGWRGPGCWRTAGGRVLAKFSKESLSCRVLG